MRFGSVAAFDSVEGAEFREQQPWWNDELFGQDVQRADARIVRSRDGNRVIKRTTRDVREINGTKNPTDFYHGDLARRGHASDGTDEEPGTEHDADGFQRPTPNLMNQGIFGERPGET